MISWIKVFEFLKGNWLPVILVLIILALLANTCISSRAEKINLLKTQTDYVAKIEDMRELKDEEFRKRAEIAKKYETLIEEITAKYEQDRETIAQRERLHIDEILEQYGGNPDALADHLGDVFGFDGVTENDEETD